MPGSNAILAQLLRAGLTQVNRRKVRDKISLQTKVRQRNRYICLTAALTSI
jgi:hypothetical protein